jgi:hypothetical protein
LNRRLLRCERSARPRSGLRFFINVQVFALHRVRGRAHKRAVGHTLSPVESLRWRKQSGSDCPPSLIEPLIFARGLWETEPMCYAIAHEGRRA